MSNHLPQDDAFFGNISPNINNREADKFAEEATLGTVVKTLTKVYGTVPVALVEDNTARETINEYNEISSLGSGSETTIVSYTVPVAKLFLFERVSAAGSNIATYRVKIDGTTIDKKYTWFSGPFSAEFYFQTGNAYGIEVAAGQVITATVIHSRPDAGDFNAKILGVLIDV